jgi:cobalt-zinc-cadmium efflux system outer membrane protein
VDASRVALLAELEALLEELSARERAVEVYATAIVPRAAEALELARVGYERGKFGYIDLLDAQRTVIDVEDGRVQALVAYDRALVRLETLLGRRIDHTAATPTPSLEDTP